MTVSRKSASWTGPLRFVLLVMALETALVGLILLEAGVFMLLGSPYVPPSALYAAVAEQAALSADGATGVLLVRSLRAGFGARNRRELATFRPSDAEDRPALMAWRHGQPASVACSPAQNVAAIGCEDGSVWLLSLREPSRPPRRLTGAGEMRVDQIAFSPDGRMLACQGSRPTVWRLASCEKLLELPKSVTAKAFAFTPDSRQLLVAGFDGALTLWSVTGLAPPQEFGTCSGQALAIACSPDARHVAVAATAGEGLELRVFHLSTRALLWRRRWLQCPPTSPVVFLQDGARLAIALRDGESSVVLALLDTRTGACLECLPGHTKGVLGVLSARDSILYSWSLDGTLRTWNLRLQRQRHCWQIADLWSSH